MAKQLNLISCFKIMVLSSTEESINIEQANNSGVKEQVHDIARNYCKYLPYASMHFIFSLLNTNDQITLKQ